MKNWEWPGDEARGRGRVVVDSSRAIAVEKDGN